MLNNLSDSDNHVKINRKNNFSGWDNAIRDAKRMIERLQCAITTYEERKEAGEPWPGDRKAGTEAESIPA